MTLTMSDFTEVDGGGYFTRVVEPAADEGTPALVEVMRADGFGFGAVFEHAVDAVVARDRAKPQPAMDGTLAALLERPVEGPASLPEGLVLSTDVPPAEPEPLPEGLVLSTEVVAADVAPTVEGDAVASAPAEEPAEEPAPAPVRRRY